MRISSVAQAARAAASIMSGRSALVGARKPSTEASRRAWSVIVCGRRAYAANAEAGMPSWRAIQATSASTG